MDIEAESFGILVNDEIAEEIRKGRLVKNGDPNGIRGCSFDMTIGTIFWNGEIIRRALGAQPAQISVPPGGVVGIFTSEDLELPNNICATAFAINKMSSKGFLVLNPGHVDPGFRGPLTVRALNVRKTPIALHQGEPIFTVIFQRIGKAALPFAYNKPREEREREFNAMTVETSPRTISDLIEIDRDGPFPGRSEVKEMIREHWLSRWSFWFSLAAVLFAFIAAALAVFEVVFPKSPYSEERHSGLSLAPVASEPIVERIVESSSAASIPDRSMDQTSASSLSRPPAEKTKNASSDGKSKR